MAGQNIVMQAQAGRIGGSVSVKPLRSARVLRPMLRQPVRRSVHTARGLPTLVRAQKDNEVVDLQQLEDLVPSTVKMAPREPGPKKVKVGKEAARKYRRNVFDFDDWVRHRSTDRYVRHLTSMARSGNVASLLTPTLTITGVSLALVLVEYLQSQGALPGWPADLPSMNMTPLSVTGPALSLLLVFRTNASYGRWDEARKMWGLMVNRSRDFVRQGYRYIDDRDVELKKQLARWTIALPKSMMCHLRDDEDLYEACGEILEPEEFAKLEASPHRPLYVLQVLGDIIAKAKMHPIQQASMDHNLTAFEDVLGGCERILKTPIPVSYTRLTSRFLIVYLSFIPWILVPQLHQAAIPATALICFFMLGIEEIGVTIEEPFSILALEIISNTIQKGVEDSLAYNLSEDPKMVKETARDDVTYIL